ncbi:MAG: PIN domain-containing protein [Chloroflexi bacterium]|nr:PIN domain-containing protein [Chloroflexota bacterium]
MSAAGLDRALAGVERILLDSSSVIAYHTAGEAAHGLAKHLLDRVQEDADPLRASISVITAAEVLIRPHRTGLAEFTYMHAFLTTFPNLTVLPMDLTVAAQAATLRSVTGLKLPDAMIVASALLAGCEAVVSNDAPWKRKLAPLFPQVRWIDLSDHIDVADR